MTEAEVGCQIFSFVKVQKMLDTAPESQVVVVGVQTFNDPAHLLFQGCEVSEFVLLPPAYLSPHCISVCECMF